jgi:hypothetical protein
LRVDDRGAGLPLTPFLFAHIAAQTIMDAPPGPFQPPFSEVSVNGLPGRILERQVALGASSDGNAIREALRLNTVRLFNILESAAEKNLLDLAEAIQKMKMTSFHFPFPSAEENREKCGVENRKTSSSVSSSLQLKVCALMLRLITNRPLRSFAQFFSFLLSAAIRVGFLGLTDWRGVRR